MLWIGRVYALFAGSLGTLSGMSMLHIFILLSITDVTKFVEFYAKFARVINLIFLVLANLALILGITMSMIYKQKSQEKMRVLDNERHSHRSQYTVAVVISFILFLCWALLFAMPYYTIQIHYMDPADITESSINMMRILYGVANILFIITFVTQ